MDLRLEAEFSKTGLADQIDALKKRIDHLRPFSQEIEDKVMQKLRLEWNYHSNAIEGNRLNYGETVAFLMTGITAKGKSLKDHLDIRGHNEAILFLLSIVKDERDFTESDIRALHKMILVEPYDSPAKTSEGIPTKKRITLGEYKTQPNHVKTITGETHFYASPEETPAKMQELMEWYREASANKEIHPLILAALFHYKFVSIHPFDDGNGRLSRILMNLILMRYGFPPVVIKMEDRQVYYANLSLADTGNYFPFIEFIGDYLTASLNLYTKAIEGGDIDEPEDIDKEITLFKLEIQGKKEERPRSSDQIIEKIIIDILDPLFKNIVQKVYQFKDLFNSSFFNFFLSKGRSLTGYSEDFTWTTIFTQLKNIEESYRSLVFNIHLLNYINYINTFDIDVTFKVSFEEYDYSIYDSNSNIILRKFYNESISKEESLVIIKSIIAFIKNNIQKKL